MPSPMLDRTRGLSFDAIDEKLIGEVTAKIAGIPRLSHSQAEEATMEGLLALYEKADQYEDRDLDSLKGLLYTFARFKALAIRDKALRHRSESLDSMIEVADETGAGRRALGAALTDESFDLDAHDEVIDLTSDPILARKYEAVTKGGSYRLMGRGASSPRAKYSEATVQRVRELHADKTPYALIAEMTGVTVSYVPALVKRRARATGSTEPWTRELAIYAVQRFVKENGRPPRSDECGGSLPGYKTVARLFASDGVRGTWNQLVRASGFEPRRESRPAWTAATIAQALFAFRREHGRWPTATEMHKGSGLPGCAASRRIWGTERASEIYERAIDEMAALIGSETCTCHVSATAEQPDRKALTCPDDTD